MLYLQIQDDLKAAMMAKDGVRVSILRLLWAGIKNKAFELRKNEPLTDDEVTVVIQKEIKQHRDSIEAYRQGNRQELVEKEEAELSILSSYLPQQMDVKTIEELVEEAITRTGATGLGDFGKVMGALMPQVRGKADGNVVSVMVKEKLGGISS